MGRINFERFDDEQLQLCLERDRVLCSPEFSRSPLMAKLLIYLIEHRLANDGTRLKAYTIAVDALDKSEDFDPQADSYPRVQIGRLRRMLDAFYGHEGGETRLNLPIGSYEIEIISNPVLQHARVGDPQAIAVEPQSTNELEDGGLVGLLQPRPRKKWLNSALIALFGAVIAVMVLAAFDEFGQSNSKLPNQVDYPSLTILETLHGSATEDISLASRVDNYTSSGLYRFEGIKVLRGEASESSKSDYYLRTRIGAGPAEEINFELLEGSTQQIIWSDTVDTDKDAGTLNLTLSKLVVAVAGPYGAIARNEREKIEGSYEAGYPCLLQLNGYLRFREEAQLQPVLQCAKDSVKAYPNDAYVLSMAAFANYISSQKNSEIKFDETVDEMALRAIKLGPQSANANFAMARTAFNSGDCDSGRKWGMAAHKLNPNDARISGYLSIYLVSCGYADGEGLAKQAVEIDPNADLAIVSALAFSNLKRGDSQAAYEITTNHLTGAPRVEPSLLLVAALSASGIGKHAEAKDYWSRIVKKYKLPDDAPARVVIRQFVANPLLAARLIADVQEAKLAI